MGHHTLADRVRQHAASIPDGLAFIAGADRLTWREYHAHSDGFAALLVDAGLHAGERVGVLLPDGVAVHVVYLAAQKAGVVVVGIGPRAGPQEIRHLLTVAGATALVSHVSHRGEPVASPFPGCPFGTSLFLRRTAAGRASYPRGGRSGSATSTSSTRRRAPPGCPRSSCTTSSGGSLPRAGRRRRRAHGRRRVHEPGAGAVRVRHLDIARDADAPSEPPAS